MTTQTARVTSTRLLLVRHGEAQGNRELRYLGVTDPPLTATGEEQARRLAEALRGAPLRALYSSPLLRARATAEALARTVAGDDTPPLAPRLEPGLREQDYGAWEGLTFAEAQALTPQAHAAWERGEVDAPPDGESLARLRERSVACATALAERHRGEVIALVSHVGPIKALVCAALGLPAQAARRMWLNPASVCIIDWRLSATLSATLSAGATDAPDPSDVAGILRLFNGGPDLATLAQALR